VNNNTLLKELAIIIPVAPGESSWIELLKDLKELPGETDVILVATEDPDVAQAAELNKSNLKDNLHWVISARGRAVQLNNGVAAARKKYLWFLHADSRLQLLSLETVQECLQKNPHAIFYFDLDFTSDGPAAVKLNAYGARIRSKLFTLPFGDQGFLMSRDTYTSVGGFPEDAPYGEDHLFIWKAKAKKIPVLSTKKKIFTSARKYQDRGWAKTTFLHVYLTLKQALPEQAKILKNRLQK